MTEFHVDTGVPWAVTWTAREQMERSAHALAAGGRVWLVDPMADDAALNAAEALGEVVAVLQLLDRHPRDCAALAKRYGVPHLRLPEQLPDTPFEVRKVVWLPGWREVALWWPEHGAFVVPEAVGTASYFAVTSGALGMHPMLRLKPPGVLREIEPRAVLSGHGAAVHENAGPALRDAVARSRRDMPKAALEGVKTFNPAEAVKPFRGRQR